jgi:thiol-disulfide isomerase/thioredoxin
MGTLNVHGQSVTKKADSGFDANAFKKHMQSFINKKNGDTFGPIEEWECINGTYFDLNKVTTPSVVFLGFSSCAPCRFYLPIFADMAAKKQYDGYNFIYITFDDSTAIREEFSSAKVTDQNLKVVTLSKAYLNANNFAMGYPTIYFLNSDKTINDLEIGGTTDNLKAARKWWHSELDKLK